MPTRAPYLNKERVDIQDFDHTWYSDDIKLKTAQYFCLYRASINQQDTRKRIDKRQKKNRRLKECVRIRRQNKKSLRKGSLYIQQARHHERN